MIGFIRALQRALYLHSQSSSDVKLLERRSLSFASSGMKLFRWNHPLQSSSVSPSEMRRLIGTSDNLVSGWLDSLSALVSVAFPAWSLTPADGRKTQTLRLTLVPPELFWNILMIVYSLKFFDNFLKKKKKHHELILRGFHGKKKADLPLAWNEWVERLEIWKQNVDTTWRRSAWGVADSLLITTPDCSFPFSLILCYTSSKERLIYTHKNTKHVHESIKRV